MHSTDAPPAGRSSRQRSSPSGAQPSPRQHGARSTEPSRRYHCFVNASLQALTTTPQLARVLAASRLVLAKPGPAEPAKPPPKQQHPPPEQPPTSSTSPAPSSGVHLVQHSTPPVEPSVPTSAQHPPRAVPTGPSAEAPRHHRPTVRTQHVRTHRRKRCRTCKLPPS